MSVAVEVARSALREVGLGHVADRVEANKIDVPTLRDDDMHRIYRPEIHRAFLLGHKAAGHNAFTSRCIDADFRWVDCIHCDECEELQERYLEAKP